MGGLGLSVGGEAGGVEEVAVSGASSAQGKPAWETDGSRGPGKSDAFPDSESSRAYLWGASEASGNPACTRDWVDEGDGQGWVEEFGLQYRSLLRIVGGMSTGEISAGQPDPDGLLKGDHPGSSDRLGKIKDLSFCLPFFANSICPNFIIQN